MDLGLQDKVAIVTGGSYGIGKAAALSMAREGARVVLVARRADVLDQAAQDIKVATEGVALPVVGDVIDKDAASRVVQTAIDNFGRVDILVNNAGASMAKNFEDVSDEDWEFDFDLKVWGAIRFIRETVPEMRKVGGGRIINVTNLGGRTPRSEFHAHVNLPRRRPGYHQGAFKGPGQGQYPSVHRVYRLDKKRPD